ncbi:MAG: hypothetical protein AAF296_07445 [Pseudomonadota bacterium]
MKISRQLLATSAIIVSSSLTGCMTAVRGPNVDMSFETIPPGAQVITDLETKDSKRARRSNQDLAPVFYGCTSTPCSFEVSRRANFNLKIEKEGYQPALICAESNLSGVGTVSAGATTAVGIPTGIAVSSTALGASSVSAGVGTYVAGGAIIGLGIGSTLIDTATGAILSIYPNDIQIELFKLDETLPKLTLKADSETPAIFFAPTAQVITSQGGIVEPVPEIGPVEVTEKFQAKMQQCLAESPFALDLDTTTVANRSDQTSPAS